MTKANGGGMTASETCEQIGADLEEVEATFRALTAKGVIVDSGRRRRSEETGQDEIVWIALRPPVTN